MGVYENMIETKAASLNWKTSLLARTAAEFGIPGASEASLSKAFNNAKDLPTHQTAYPLNSVLDRFIQMTNQFAPFKLRLDDPVESKKLLEDFESGELSVKIQRFELRTPIQPFYVVLVGEKPFKCTTPDAKILLTDDYESCAAFRTFQSARAVAKLLDVMGQMGIRVTTITNVRREPETIIESISAVGFTEDKC
jgi:hypothetical protein